MENQKPRVEVTENGPYEVTGSLSLAKGIMVPGHAGVPYAWKKGEAYPAEETYYLCRCGNSGNKPFCDDTHLRIPFDGTETADNKKFAEQAITTEGPDLVLHDARSLCSSAGFCMRAGGIGNLVTGSYNPESKETAIREALDCPSGRLVVSDKKTGQAIEEKPEPSIIIAEDPGRKLSGPLYLKGGIEVVSSGGKQYETRNRVTLCRCGKSRNKPFCDGSHIKAGFTDGDESIK